jgi:sulfide:quinone oxidoreductase
MTTKVLIAGGGVAALEGALALRALAEEHVQVELLAAEPHFWYRPMAVAEPFELGEVMRLELTELAAAAGARVTPGTLVGVDAAARVASTAGGPPIPYDVLLLAFGARPLPAVPGALTFRGPADTDALRRLLAEVERGDARRIAFAVPAGATWTLPAYELALLTAARFPRESGVDVLLVTPEPEPLALFGRAASDAIRELVDAAGIELHTGTYPAELVDGELRLVLGGELRADRVVALPRLQGQRIDGIPQTVDGFVPVDAHCRVDAFAGLYAAGDITAFPVKQGGLAAQQAHAAAEAIAAEAGADVEPHPFRPVLRGLLLTGAAARYLRNDLGDAEPGGVSAESLWWPPAKIVGRHLGPFLAARAGQEALAPPTHRAVSVDLPLPPGTAAPAPTVDALARERRAEDPHARVVRDAMRRDPLLVAPQDTLGEVAERMRERDFASALVTDYGRLIGILTSRDLLRAFAGRAHPSEARVREWMTAEPVAVTAATTLEAAALLMTEHRVHHLAVVEGSRPVGIVGLRDAVRPEGRGLRVSVGLGF